MTDFAVQCVIKPTISPFLSKDKGDIANRVQCATEQAKNSLVTGAKVGVVAGTTGLLAFVGKKSPKLVQKFGQVAGKVIDKVLKTTKGSANPKLAAIGAVLVPALAALSYVVGEGIYKSGQIDQKYTDAAKVEAREKGYLL
jgi:hypothetical protein